MSTKHFTDTYSLFLSAWPPIIILALHILRQIFLPTFIQIDVLAHFLGGVSIAWMCFNLYTHARHAKQLPALPLYLLYSMFITAAITTGVFWEFWEYYLLPKMAPTMLTTFDDTMMDLVLDTVGAMSFCVMLVANLKTRKQGC